MIFNKVVAQFKDKTIMKGKTFNFSPNRAFFHLHRLDGMTVDVELENLKALFFIKDYVGDKNRQDRYNDVIAGGGKKIDVKFFDGEVVKGFTYSYNPDRQGFFLVPASVKGNNNRIFIVKSATMEITYALETGLIRVVEPSFAF
jgi:hypothetical protein